MMYDTLYEYYCQQEVLPTYGGFQSRSDLEAHEWHRRSLFTEKLFLPPRLFQNARLIEFGPDAGENSLVFALWGATCTLIEPNPKAHPLIRGYFKRFELSHRLVGLKNSDLKAFSEQPIPSEKFDFIDAEGFIYTVKPESVWIDLFARLLSDDGFVILFDVEAFGSFMELLLKVIYARVRQLTGMSALEAAQKLFTAKWNSIPHKRSMESWIMDVLGNPFVRLRYFFEPQSLCKQMYDAGFYLYSSWPPCKDVLSVHWFKKTLMAEEELRLQNEFIARSRLSHLFGRKHFLLRLDPALEQSLWRLLTLTDSLIDQFDAGCAAQCVEYLSALVKLINSDAVMAEAQDTRDTLQAIRSVQHIFRLLTRGAIAELIAFCNNDQAFTKTWGMPALFTVFGKRVSPQPAG